MGREEEGQLSRFPFLELRDYLRHSGEFGVKQGSDIGSPLCTLIIVKRTSKVIISPDKNLSRA